MRARLRPVAHEAGAFVEAHGRLVARGDGERQQRQPIGAARLGDERVQQRAAETCAAPFGAHHRADDVADVAHLDAQVALASDRADQGVASPSADHELPAVGSVQAESAEVARRGACRLGGGVGGEGFGSAASIASRSAL